MRPKRWINKPAPTAPLREDRLVYDKLVRTTPGEIDPHNGKILTDPAVLDLIQKAQKLVAAQGKLTGAWSWDEVAQTVASLGKDIQIVTTPTDDLRATFQYLPVSNSLQISTGSIKKMSLHAIASGLVHESTHVVFLGEALRMTGFTRMEYMWISQRCQDVSIADTFADEAMAYQNQAAWCAADGHACGDSVVPGSILDTALKAHAGRLEDRRELAQKFATFAVDNSKTACDKVNGMHMTCEPMAIVRGHKRGSFFFPTDVAPEILVPLLDLVP